MTALSIIIPIYNEEKNIETTIGTIRDVLTGSNIKWEIIAINDGSDDKSLEILHRMKDITIISHKTNKGYGSSLKTGIRHAKYNDITITDADGTYPNKKIPEMFDYYIENKLDMLVGARTGKNVSYPFYKKIPKFFISKLSNYISNTKIPDINSGLRIFKKDIALKYFHLYPNQFSFTTTITLCMLCSGYEVDFLPVDYFKRVGKSKIRPIRDTIQFFNLLLKIAIYFNPFKFFFPIITLFSVVSIGVLIRDVFYLKDLTQSGVLLPVFTFLLFILGLLADLIIKRTQ